MTSRVDWFSPRPNVSAPTSSGVASADGAVLAEAGGSDADGATLAEGVGELSATTGGASGRAPARIRPTTIAIPIVASAAPIEKSESRSVGTRPEGGAEPAAPGPDLAQLAVDREALAVVETALGTLPAEQRTALLLRDVEGFAYEEIAVITSVEIGTVKSRIHRGRVAVRNVLIARGWRGPEG